MLVAEIYYQKGYFNRVSRSYIPATWKGEIISGLECLNNNYTTFQIYSYGHVKEEVINDLKEQLKQLGIKGKLKIIS